MTDALALVALLERALAESARRFVDVQRARDPESGARSRVLSGAHVVVDGGRHAGSNISRVYGLGLDAPCDRALLDEVARFFANGRFAARALVYAPVEPRARPSLVDAGFSPLRTDVVLWRAIDDGPRDAARDEPSLVWDDLGSWTRALAPAFDAEHEREETLLHRHAAFVAPPNAAFAVVDEGAIVAGGALALEGEVAYFLADGTRSEARGRGHQGALIDARVRYAKLHGARHAFAITADGVVSERNYLRAGFVRLCTAEIFTRPSTT